MKFIDASLLGTSSWLAVAIVEGAVNTDEEWWPSHTAVFSSLFESRDSIDSPNRILVRSQCNQGVHRRKQGYVFCYRRY